MGPSQHEALFNTGTLNARDGDPTDGRVQQYTNE